MVARHLLNKGDDVITVGLDDTTKAAGHRLFDIKTDSITITQASGEKRLLTTGYLENASHAGKAGAEAYNFNLQCLAILAGSSVDEIKSNIDFWMTDRAADCSKMLTILGIEPAKFLKCCAHLLLCIDHSIDKTFRDTEQITGFDKLINASKILHSTSYSLHTLGLIALAKLMSPSHASHSVSLHNQFKEWLAGRTSQPVQDVKQLEKDFLATVKMAKRLALLKKEELKKKRNEKMLKVLESCKTHIGSVTPTTINLLDRLTESQLITEICYIRLTICPDIHQKRRIKLPNGHFKFQTFSKAELKQTIITVIKPGNNVVENIDEIVKDALKSH
ncbi:hypothetical protein LOTGIDRAFT_162271 [Lottia gigantea]|uniref:Uncharacterized protein n=1 Tax=Lottia gigantea TaxID=225164 RepID=V4ACF5_LOTGI|nr:hypothetical protein LOTGIDRAFT_162271 [Lottia gigantea]ESO92790.1 hypothetical protein LOTGIDRAFT_162271 [Lottia gigantea]